MRLTLIPPRGIDYFSPKAVLDGFDKGNKFIISDIPTGSHVTDKGELKKLGIKSVTISYNDRMKKVNVEV